MFFLLIALTQFIDILKVGFLFTYIAPLAFVLFLTMAKEFYDDYNRYKRDKEVIKLSIIISINILSN
jgi:phospholipid-translocating ATPase